MILRKILLLAIVALVVTSGWIFLQRNSSTDNALLEAAGVGDIDRAKEALRAGANMNATDFDMGTTPLIFAARRNDLPMAMLLVKAGAKLDSQDSGGSALYYACADYANDVGMYLRGAGAQIRASSAALSDLKQDKTVAAYCRQ